MNTENSEHMIETDHGENMKVWGTHRKTMEGKQYCVKLRSNLQQRLQDKTKRLYRSHLKAN